MEGLGCHWVGLQTVPDPGRGAPPWYPAAHGAGSGHGLRETALRAALPPSGQVSSLSRTSKPTVALVRPALLCPAQPPPPAPRLFKDLLQPGRLRADLSQAGQRRRDGGRGGSSGWSPGTAGAGGEVASPGLAEGPAERAPVSACAPPPLPAMTARRSPSQVHLTETRGPTVAAPRQAGWEKAHGAGRTPGRPGIGRCLSVPGRMPARPWAAFPSERLSRQGNPQPKGLRRRDRVGPCWAVLGASFGVYLLRGQKR